MLSFRHPPSLAVLCAVLMVHGLLIGALLMGVNPPTPVAPQVNAPTPHKVQSVRLLDAPSITKPVPPVKPTLTPTLSPSPVAPTSLNPRAIVPAPAKAVEPVPRPLAPVGLAVTAPVSTPTNLPPIPDSGTALPTATAPPAGAKSALRSDEGGDFRAKASAAPARGGSTSGDNGVTLPDAQPYYQSNPKAVYPQRSRLLREEGKVVLRVWVGADGQPTKAEVASSSGYEGLNASALRAVMEWRFTPGKRKGQAEAMEVLVPLQFRLDGN